MGHSLINILTPDQRRALENVRAAAERIWARPLHRYYTDHTPQGHSARVIALLDGLTAGMMATDKRLAPGEAFVLLAAANLHDIGMQNEKYAGGNIDEIRDAHHEQTAEMIYAVFEDPANAFSIPLAGDPTVAEAVALVAKGHRRVELAAAEYDPLVYGGETLRLRLLAALLRFGDELDIDHRRVDMEQLKLLALPTESLLYWWKCYYVSGVSIQDEYIRIAYRFPQDRSDYEGLIVPLVEGEVRARNAELEEIFRVNAVKVALGKSQVRLMRLVQPLPPEVEKVARERVESDKGKGGEGTGSRKQEAVGKPAARSLSEQPPSRRKAIAAVSDVELSSLQRQLAEARENLRLIQERKAEFVLSTDVPIQLVKEERRLLDKIAGLEQQIGARSGRGLPAGAEASPSALFDQRGQTVGTQVNVAGDYVEQRPAGGPTYHIHIEQASGLAIGDGARVVQGGGQPGAPAESGGVEEPAEAAPPGDYRYDAFISYSHQDSDWVRKMLLPHLERAGLRICIDFRDFEIGVPSLVNMENAVEGSRKTLLALTPAWVASEWTAFEALLIQTKDPAGRARRILPLLVRPCQLPGRLGIFTYLDLTNPAEFDAQMGRLVAAVRSAPA
jgi:hypothetical protein